MVKIYAHRGNKSEFSENSLEAFDSAVYLGVAGIELDVHLSKDHELIVIHDETIDRTSNQTGYVKDLTLAELREAKLLNPDGTVSDNKIPTLDEVIDLLAEKKFTGELNIELKTDQIEYENIEAKVLQLIEQKDVSFDVIYSSFNWNSLKRIREIDADATIALLVVQSLLDKYADRIPELHANALHIDHLLTETLPENLLNKYPLRIWTVNGQDNLKHYLFDSKIELEAIMTDEPFQALELIRLHSQIV